MAVNESQSSESAFDRLFRGFFLIAVMAFVVVNAFYFWRFARYGVSASSQDWSNYGGYVGGTLGAFFGMLAFIGVLITIMLQRRQIDFARSQANRDALHRFIERIAESLDSAAGKDLSNPPSSVVVKLNLMHPSLGSVLALAAKCGRLSQSAEYLVAGSNRALIEDIRTAAKSLTTDMAQELAHLKRGLAVYLTAHGDTDVASLYVERYAPFAQAICAIGVDEPELFEILAHWRDSTSAALVSTVEKRDGR